MRVDKYISNGGYFSRSDIKKLIKNKKILINDTIVLTASTNVDINIDKVFVNGSQIIFKEFYYIMLNKPSGYLSATKDEVNYEKTIIDLLEERYKNIGLFPVGRLDKDTEGLIILSNNGKFAHNTLSPKKHVNKKYYAKIFGIVNESHIKMFRNGIKIDNDYLCKPAELEILSIDNEEFKSEIILTISEGKFHQVKKMFLSISKEVYYLKRIMFADIYLDSSLKVGEYRELTDTEFELIKIYI